MIFDTLSNAHLYTSISPKLAQLLEEAKKIYPYSYPENPIELDGDNLFILAPRYETHDVSKAMFETHRKYIDVFVMVEGSEIVYVKNISKLKQIVQPYSPEGDAMLAAFQEDALPVRLEPGDFLVLFPEDGHAPQCNANGTNLVKKLIGKIRI